MRKFIREYQLDFGKPLIIEALPPVPFTNYDQYVKSRKEETNLYRVTDLNIRFDVQKNLSSVGGTNTNKITIYNLSEEKVNYLSQIAGTKGIVFLKAGYQGNIKEIFRGNIERVENSFSRETRETTILLLDGGVNKREATTSRTYRKGTSYKVIVEDIMEDVGLAKGNVQLDHLVDKLVPSNAIYFEGNAVQQLSRIGASFDANYFIDNGQSCWMPQEYMLKKKIAVISEGTGLIDSVEPLDASQGVSQTDKANSKKGYKFKCLLDGAITIGTTVFVKSRNYEGALKVISVSHKGSFEGNDWYTEVEGEISPFEIV